MKQVAMFPGQGTQQRGMGGALFDAYPDLVEQADAIMGLSMRRLCLEDPDRLLDRTDHAQPAIFLVNALAWRRRVDEGFSADLALGHSLGEFSALCAAGALDFASGFALVRRRGALMAAAAAGAMSAILGLEAGRVARLLEGAPVVIANWNGPDQIVISGPAGEVDRIGRVLERAGAQAVVPLRVSGAFHSPLMAASAAEFARVLDGVGFESPRFPVIANVTARPHETARIGALLAAHLTSPVLWRQSIEGILAEGEAEFHEIGESRVLQGMVKGIRAAGAPLPGARLGSAEFRRDHGVRLSYAAGGMYRAVASGDLVALMARAGLLSFFGSGGLEPAEVESQLRLLRDRVGPDAPAGVNVLPVRDDKVLEIVRRLGFTRVEAAAYVEPTPALCAYRAGGLSRGADGAVRRGNLVMAKLSRIEVAERFLSPPPQAMLDALVSQAAITPEQAALAARLPLADDICAEADSAGHTDKRSPLVLLPAIQAVRQRLAASFPACAEVRIGAAGGIGTPEAAAAMFLMGADFVLTGSINQCTAEAGTSGLVKDMLQAMTVHDTAYAPSGDFFEMGAQIQVLRRGVFFPVRAARLFELYQRHERVEDIDAPTRRRVEGWFGRDFDAVWRDCLDYHPADEIARAEANPKHRIALIFRWYFGQSVRHAMAGRQEHRTDFQIHTGPAMGAFNAWVEGTALADWRNRHADDLALRLMAGAEAVFERCRAR